MRKSSPQRNGTSQPAPKASQKHVPVPHDARTRLEECIVEIHSLASYHEDELTTKEIEFLKKVTRNLAAIHRRLTDE